MKMLKYIPTCSNMYLFQIINDCFFIFRENYVFTCRCTKCEQQADDPDETSDDDEDEEMDDYNNDDI